MGFLSSVWHFVQPLLTPLGVMLAGWLHAKATSSPSDAEKAAHLAAVAKDAAALVYSMFPNLPDKELVGKIIATLSTIAGVPTDPAVLERAAFGALSSVKPLAP